MKVKTFLKFGLWDEMNKLSFSHFCEISQNILARISFSTSISFRKIDKQISNLVTQNEGMRISTVNI